jgi:hypothetical protein
MLSECSQIVLKFCVSFKKESQIKAHSCFHELFYKSFHNPFHGPKGAIRALKNLQQAAVYNHETPFKKPHVLYTFMQIYLSTLFLQPWEMDSELLIIRRCVSQKKHRSS